MPKSIIFAILDNKMYDSHKKLVGVRAILVNCIGQKTYSKPAALYTENFINAVRKGEIYLFNGSVSKDGKIRIYNYSSVTD